MEFLLSIIVGIVLYLFLTTPYEGKSFNNDRKYLKKKDKK